MPKSLNNYKNPEKAQRYRNRQRNENYKKGNFGDGTKRYWTKSEINLILFPEDKTDRMLASELKRSVRAVQIKRCRLNQQGGE